MRGNVRHTPSMSPVGKKQSWVEEMQTKDRSQNFYDVDGTLSTAQHQEIKMSMTLPALPSTEDNFLNPDWRKLAICKGKTAQFFRHRCSVRCINHASGCNRVRVVRESKAMCLNCPVLEHCRVWSIETNLLKGIAGGLTEVERRTARTILKGEDSGNEEEYESDDYCW